MVLSAKVYRKNVFAYLRKNKKLEAAQALWPWMGWNDQTLALWKQLDENPKLAVMGHGSASKTFTACAWYLLDWWRYPEKTALAVTSSTLVSIRARAWSDLKRLHGGARVSMPGIVVDHRMTIKADEGDSKHAIMCLAAEGNDSAAKIQGLHTERISVLIDEADNPFSDSIWPALANLKTSGEFRATALANPEDRNSEFGKNCEPLLGWSSANIDTDHEWTSRAGWKVMRLDGLKSPNIVGGIDKFPYLLKRSAVDEILKEHGPNSSEYMKYVRAWFPEINAFSTVFSQEIVNLMIDKSILFYGARERIAALDPSFSEGGDTCALCFGWSGFLASDPSRAAVTFDVFEKIKKSNSGRQLTMDFAHQAMDRCKEEGVKPQHFGMDSTGAGSTMADYIKTIWDPKIICVSFQGAATERKILTEDSKTCDQRFGNFVSELWWAAREWARVGALSVFNGPRELRVQAESRRYKTMREKITAEPKKDMKERGQPSPDEMDAVAIGIEVVRRKLMISQQTGVAKNQQRPHVDLPGKPMKAHKYEQTYGVSADS